MRWRPLSRRAAAEDDEFDGLHEGVPAWLHSGLVGWVNGQLLTPGIAGQIHVDVDRLRLLELRLHIANLDWSSPLEAERSLLHRCLAKPDLFLDVIDVLVATTTSPNGYDVRNLSGMLGEGGSAWTVGRSGQGHFELQRRVDATVTEAARATMTGAGRAGRLLAAAWSAAYGRHPNPGHAYREAVRAVEAAAAPIVSPADTLATLGRILGVLRSERRFAVALQPVKGDPTDALISMLELLWTAQLDRHGTADESVPLTVSETEAQTAVQLATTLVQWFSAGSIVPVPKPSRP